VTGRFSNVRRKETSADPAPTPAPAEPKPEQAAALPTHEPVIVPATLKKPEGRSPLGVRVRPSLQAHLNHLVEEYRGQGWEISQHTILEHFLSRLSDPEYAQAFMQDLAQQRR
jgi:hypothetical protein